MSRSRKHARSLEEALAEANLTNANLEQKVDELEEEIADLKEAGTVAAQMQKQKKTRGHMQHKKQNHAAPRDKGDRSSEASDRLRSDSAASSSSTGYGYGFGYTPNTVTPAKPNNGTSSSWF